MTIGDTEASGGRPRKRSAWRLALWSVAALVLATPVVLAGGFAWFVSQVSNREIALGERADGIVVLTGGASRVSDAVELLASGHGRRLLITGVNPTTNPGELKRHAPDQQRLFDCCVDLGYAAVNTIGNALETRRWTVDNGFRSLIVVTSSYHMPRAMAELAHRLPDVRLIPFPVVTEKRRAEPWWSNAAAARLIVVEYVKYVAACARMQIDRDLDAQASLRRKVLRG